jgi:hypothetical protein
LDTQRILREVEAEITKLKRVAGVLRGISSESGVPSGDRRQMSAAAKKKISLAQKARWAKSAATPKRTMSAAGRKRIAAAQRARWAKVKAQQK